MGGVLQSKYLVLVVESWLVMPMVMLAGTKWGCKNEREGSVFILILVSRKVILQTSNLYFVNTSQLASIK